MVTQTRASALDDFAAEFIAPFEHYSEVRTEGLSESVRRRFNMPPFPHIDDLRNLCQALGIPIWDMNADIPEVLGMNISYGGDVNIAVQRSLSRAARETTIVHEIRETLENAFRRVKPSYVALPTHDNHVMHGYSERFGSYLLMESEASRALMREVGFDVIEFARRTERSLPSVILRLQQLFPARPASSPVLGVWLFESPWERTAAGLSQAEDLEAAYVAKLNGFSQRKGSAAARVFPRPGDSITEFEVLTRSIAERQPCSVTVQGMGLDDGMNYLAIAHPIFARGAPWRALLTAVRLDGLPHLANVLTRRNPFYLGEQWLRI